MSTQDELVAALDNHQVTDDEGNIAEDTAAESTPENETTASETETAEKSAESEDSTPVETDETETGPDLVPTAEDETGQRYVPEKRFKEVYAKWKEEQRKNKTLPVMPQMLQTSQAPKAPVEKTDALEIEMLRSTMPQFNPESPDYSQEIDELGFSLYEASKDAKGRYTMTRLDAGRKALRMAKQITSKVADVKTEARIVKAQQSDQGITNRVLNRKASQTPPEKMSLEEKEAWLKANGEW